MPARQRRYNKEELAKRGKELYSSHIRHHVEPDHTGKIIAIDVDTHEFEIDEDTLVASNRLLEKCPKAQIWFVRIGHRGVHRFGWQEL